MSETSHYAETLVKEYRTNVKHNWTILAFFLLMFVFAFVVEFYYTNTQGVTSPTALAYLSVVIALGVAMLAVLMGFRSEEFVLLGLVELHKEITQKLVTLQSTLKESNTRHSE